MRLPSIPVGAGRRLTMADVMITVHNVVGLRDHEVLAMDRPKSISGYNRSYMGLLSLEDVDIESLKLTARKWVKGSNRFALRDVVASDDLIDVVTQPCRAGAVMKDATVLNGFRIPKHDSTEGSMEQVERVVAAIPDLVTCTEDTAAYKAYCLTVKGSQQVEMLHSRVDPSPLSDLPAVLPAIENLSSYHLILYLEDRCGFNWCKMPSKKADRRAISFRHADRGSPRFWCSGQACIDHHYLRALATAASSESDIVEVIHGEKHSYYLELLGISVQKDGPQPLAVDDGEIDFPEPKRKRDNPVLEDGDIEEPDEEDEDDNVAAILDLDFEEALAAELALDHIVEQQDIIDDHIDADHGGDGAAGAENDQERQRAMINPSEYNHKWGPFTFTLKRPRRSPNALYWQCSCPFHRRSINSGCKKTMSMNAESGLSAAAESDRVLDCLKHWANQAVFCNRQRTHLGINVLPGEEPPKEVVNAQMITKPRPKQQDVLTDRQLDVFDDDDGSSSSA